VDLSPGGGKLSSLTTKSFIVGALLSLFIGIDVIYGELIINTTHTNMHFSTGAGLTIFIALVGGVNLILKALNRRLALDRAELVAVYVMLVVACAIPKWNVAFVLPTLAGPIYYATPENDWVNILQPYLPNWLIPESFEAIRDLYEGLPAGRGIPWGDWIKPLISWLVFLAALWGAMACMMVILRKQWVENEKLTYPLVQVPLEMIREEDKSSIVNPFFKNKLMWIGVLFPLLVGCTRALHNYYHFIPEIKLNSAIPVFRRTETLHFSIDFFEIGIFYLIRLDVALSIWLFYLLTLTEKGIFNIMGISPAAGYFDSRYGVRQPIISYQGMGAIIVLVILGLWVGKKHLRDVFRKAFKDDPSVDDSDEILSYRTAVLGLIICLIFIGLWTAAIGLPAWAVPLVILVAFILFTGITRIVVEGGVPRVREPISTPGFVISSVGATAFTPRGLTALAYTALWAADLRNFAMASYAHSLKLVDEVGGRKRRFAWAISAAAFMSFIGSTWALFHWGYKLGGINLGEACFEWGARRPFEAIQSVMGSPAGPNLGNWISTGVGALIMAFLMIARHRLPWWPLHPLGFPVGTVVIMDSSWFNIFIAWVAKSIIIRYGGPRLYRKIRPFFLGLVVGVFLTAGLWYVIDLITGMTWNDIFFRHG